MIAYICNSALRSVRGSRLVSLTITVILPCLLAIVLALNDWQLTISYLTFKEEMEDPPTMHSQDIQSGQDIIFTIFI